MKNFFLFFFSVTNYIVYAQTIDNIAITQGIEHTVVTQLQYGGHGVGFFDFDNDGWDDITFVQELDSVVLYKNNNGVFELIPSVAFQVGQIRQALWVDYDNDGDYDLFITSTNGFAKLYQNDGNFNFTDVTTAAGISNEIANNFGVSFADYDNDGYLDFYLARYQMSGDLNNPAHFNALYRNNGDGTFIDVTAFAGVADSIQPSFMGAWIDINRNGLPDLYVINDRVLWGNSMYLNNGDGTFTDITAICGAEMFGEDPMGITFADYDNDGDIDFVLSNGGPPTKPVRLYTNNGDETFFENGVDMGIWVYETFMCTWGGSWIDIDNNTFLDLYMTTGLLMPATGEARNYLFMSDSAQALIDSPTLFSGDHIAASYSVAKGDIDNDGYADMVVQTAKDYNSFIWKNNYGPTTGNNYIKITLQGTMSNLMAIGSWITVYCQGNTYTHYTRCGESFISQDSQHHIFGLGQYETIDSIVVDYQSGITDVYYNVPVNQHLYLYEAETLVFNLDNPANSNFICPSSEIVLTAPIFSSYLWNTGETTQSISISQSGDYSVIAWDFNGFPYTSDTVSFQLLPDPYIFHSIEHNLCFGEVTASVELSLFNANANHEIIWSNGGTGLSQSELASGYYSYDYSDPYGCSFSDSFEITSGDEIIVFYEVTPQTSFELGSLQVYALGGEPPYDYYLNGNPIGIGLVELDSGTYVVTLIDALGCSTNIEIVVGFVDLSDLNKNDLNNFLIYPNPVYDKSMCLQGVTFDNVLEITDVLGKQVSYYKLENDHCLELLDISPGIIYVSLRVGSEILRYKVVVLN